MIPWISLDVVVGCFGVRKSIKTPTALRWMTIALAEQHPVSSPNDTATPSKSL